MAESRFGRDALGNSAFVSGLRDLKRSPTLDTLNRIADFMATRDADIGFVTKNEADSHRPFPVGTSPTFSPTSARRPSSGESQASSNGSPDANVTADAA